MDKKWTTNLLLLPPITAALIDKWADEKHRIPKLVQTKYIFYIFNISPYFNSPFLTHCGIDREAVKCFLFARNFIFVGMALGDSRKTSVWTGSVGPSLVFVRLDIKMATHVTKANCVQSEATLESCHSSSSSSDSVSDGRLAAEGLPGDRQDGEEGLVIPQAVNA